MSEKPKVIRMKIITRDGEFEVDKDVRGWHRSGNPIVDWNSSQLVVTPHTWRPA